MKEAIHQTVETTGDLIGNKIADKIMKVSRKCYKILQMLQNLSEDGRNKLVEYKKILQNEKKYLIINIRKYFNSKKLLLYKGKYEKLFSSLLVFKKFSLTKQKM